MTSQSRGEWGERGFANGALYDAARPNYPAEALEFFTSTFELGPTSRVLDLGAGSGIFSRQLAPYVGRVIAVDPSASMRETLAATSPDIEVLDGRDTAIPLPDDSVDVVVVAQAFHWFDVEPALAEMHRVLVSGGGLGFIWNERDESTPWVRELSVAMRWNLHQPYRVGTDFRPAIARGPFEEIERHRFTHEQILSHQGLRARVLSTSYLSLMGEVELAALMRDVQRVIDELPDPVVLPYCTDAYRARAV